MKNKYTNRSKISEAKFRQILRCFTEDFDSTQTSKLTGISRRTISDIYQKLRLRIFQLTENEEKLSGEIEADESYFGAKRIRGKRGRGARGKVPVFGLLKRNGKVYTVIVKNCERRQLMPIIKGKILEDSTIYTDGWTSYDSLVLNGYKHYRIYHSKDEFARGKNHVNGIESFWSYAKRRIAQFNGVPRNKFILHLKESEWRFNHRSDNIYKVLMKGLSQNPL
ncbi:MAG TPA: IS1595 family transposase [Candidatus Dojkabacteria bacterium]|nr:IS1595 family transposase [Candidatus Dojkabacteria bacterium]